MGGSIRTGPKYSVRTSEYAASTCRSQGAWESSGPARIRANIGPDPPKASCPRVQQLTWRRVGRSRSSATLFHLTVSSRIHFEMYLPVHKGPRRFQYAYITTAVHVSDPITTLILKYKSARDLSVRASASLLACLHLEIYANKFSTSSI